jgi:hypothetical protein
MYRAFLNNLKEGDTVEVSLKKQRRKKTNPQLGYWYGILIPFAVDALREAGHNTLFEVSVGNLKTGVSTDKETVDLLFKVLFKTHASADKVPQKRNMTTEQMSELIDFALKWLAENLGVFAPTPKD